MAKKNIIELHPDPDPASIVDLYLAACEEDKVEEALLFYKTTGGEPRFAVYGDDDLTKIVGMIEESKFMLNLMRAGYEPLG